MIGLQIAVTATRPLLEGIVVPPPLETILLTNEVVDEANDTISFDISEASNVYWVRHNTAGTILALDVIADAIPTSLQSGSFAVLSGTVVAPVVFDPGNNGLQRVSFVAQNSSGEVSRVLTVDIDIQVAPASPTIIENFQTDPYTSVVNGLAIDQSPVTLGPLLTTRNPVTLLGASVGALGIGAAGDQNFSWARIRIKVNNPNIANRFTVRCEAAAPNPVGSGLDYRIRVTDDAGTVFETIEQRDENHPGGGNLLLVNDQWTRTLTAVDPAATCFEFTLPARQWGNTSIRLHDLAVEPV